MWGTHFMNTKTYLILYYSIAGIIISLFTAIMTYYIIDVPIGSKMIFKIFLTILLTLPIIGLLSYLIGSCLSQRLFAISNCLNNINEDKFLKEKHEENITDISAIHESIHQLSKRLERSIGKLKDSNQQLNNTIISLSHDIRTPLTIIEGYLEELEDDIVAPERRTHVMGILKKETAYIQELSSEVIHYIQSLETDIQQEPIHLKSFAYEKVCPLLRVKEKVTLECELDEDFTLMFNPIALKTILINLLHNASKHTVEGEIRLKVKEEKILIEDSGIGIEPQFKETIFQTFYALDESRNRKDGGFGLGLSIARNLAENNGYQLYLDTNYQKGCRFILSKIKVTIQSNHP